MPLCLRCFFKQSVEEGARFQVLTAVFAGDENFLGYDVVSGVSNRRFEGT